MPLPVLESWEIQNFERFDDSQKDNSKPIKDADSSSQSEQNTEEANIKSALEKYLVQKITFRSTIVLCVC